MNRYTIALCLAVVTATGAAAQNPPQTNRDLYERIHGVRGALQRGNTFSTRLPFLAVSGQGPEYDIVFGYRAAQYGRTVGNMVRCASLDRTAWKVGTVVTIEGKITSIRPDGLPAFVTLADCVYRDAASQ